MPESFHFLRPAWLAALLPLALLVRAAARSAAHASAWRRVVDPHLLRHLLLTDAGETRRWPLALGAIGGAAACLALAGPTWERIPQPTFTSSEPTVVVLDLSPAMQADDLSPSRLGRARLELHDLLERSKGGQVGLVLYTDEPFVAAPLTDDGRLIEEMIPTLESGLMPLRAPRPDRALEQAKALLDQAGAAGGRVLLITADAGAHGDETLAAARALATGGRTLSVLGAGTDEGAPLRDARGRVVEDADGKPVLAKLDRSALEALASAGGGRFSEVRPDDSDLALVAPVRAAASRQASSAGSSAQFDAWRDAGVWLVLVPLLLAPLLFRRGLVAALALSVLAAAPARAEAGTWSDLWSRRDQQGEAALAAGDAAAAAGLFEDPAWQAAATYQSGAYDASVERYASLGGTENRYNLGNAQARSGKLAEAVKSYNEVLATDPQHADAKFNRDLVQRLLDEQRRQQQQQQQQQQASSGDGQQEQPQGGNGEAQQNAGRSAGNQQQDAGGSAGDHAQQNAGDQPQQAAGESTQGEQAQNENTGEKPDGRDASATASRDATDGTQQAEQHQAGAASQQQEQKEQQQAQAGDAAAQPERQPAHDAASAASGDQQEAKDDAAEAAHASAPDDAGTPGAEQQTARGNAAQGDDATSPRDEKAAREAAERNEAARQDRKLAQDLDQALARDDAHEDGAPQEQAQQRASSSDAPQPMTEREQAREQALRNIPDDPGGLLRAKIRRQYAEKRYSRQEVSPSW